MSWNNFYRALNHWWACIGLYVSISIIETFERLKKILCAYVGLSYLLDKIKQNIDLYYYYDLMGWMARQ